MSIFTRSTLGYADNQVVFNDITTDPYYRVNTRAPQKYQIRQEDIPVPFESGVADFKTLVGDTMYVIQGTMYPRSETTYDTGLNALRDVSNLDLDDQDPFGGALFTNDGYVPYMWGDSLGALSKQMFVSPLYVMASESTRQGFVVPFTIYCKIKDPVIYGGTLKTASTANGSPIGSIGSAIFPFAFPMAFGATAYTVTADAENVGTVPVYPESIDVYGPITNPKITNGSTGEYIQVNAVLNSSTDHLQVQYGKDYLSVTLNGVNYLNQKSTDTTFFKIQPGGNTISITGSSIGTAAYVTVDWYDGYSLA